MDIFRALKEEGTPETYLQSLLRKGAKRDVPYIANIHLSDEIQQSLHIDFSLEGLSLDRPWKTIPKKVLLKHIQRFKDKSPFFPYADNLKTLRDPEVLIGLDTSNLKNLTNYYLCVTQEGKTAVLEELKSLHKRIMEHINNSFSKEPGKWEPLGSETDLKAPVAVNNRPLISYEWVGNKIDRMNRSKPLAFTTLDADSNAHTLCSIVDKGRSKYKLVEAVAVHTPTQVSPMMIDAPAQTIPEIPMNASTQFNPEIDAQEKEERIQNQAPLDESVLAEQLKRQYDKIMSALTYNGEYDLYKDDYEYLVKEGSKSGVVSTQTYVHFLTFVNTMCDPNKYITCTAWHPGLCGTVAVAYGDNVIFKYEEIQSDSDDSDYEVKPSKPEEQIPKINPVILASEVVEAALWKASCHEMLEHFDKKEDISSYKLGLMTILYLEHAQRVRDREIYLEKKYEEIRPELEAMEFTQEFSYDMYEYDEASYNPEDDLIYNFRLDEYSNVPPDPPEESYLIKFDDLLKPFLQKDYTPIIQEAKTMAIVWDTNNWFLGFSLKEEATVVHRRHFMQALADAGPLLETPRPKTYCPFLRTKRTGYRFHKTTDKSKKKRSVSSRGSVLRRPSKRSSTISKSSDTLSIASHQSSKSKHSNPEPKKKQPSAKYIEVSDDEEMERHAKEHEIVETGPSHNIYIWSIHNDLEPLLKLVSPYEVSAMNFCPHNGDLLAAGTISGQIVLWDLQGRLLETDESEPTNFERYARKELKRRMSWYRELRVPGQIRETAVSTMFGAHNSKVIAIHWVHPQLVFQNGHFLHIEAEDDLANHYSLQFLSTSVDGDIRCWDLKNEPLPKNEYMFTERTIARRIKNPKPELLVSLTSKYAEYHNRWIPTYMLKEPVTENAKGVKSQCSLLASSVQFHTKLYPYKRKYPPDPRFKDKMTDLVEYVYNPQPKDQVTYSHSAFIGTMFGVVALLSWSGQPPNPKPNDPTDSEIMHITVMEAVHDGPIIGVLRHPFVSDVALSVGGHVWAIWNYEQMTWPLKWKKYYGKQITCCSWSPLKPSLFRIGLTDGTVEIWDLILQSHEPKVVIPAAGVSITGFSSHNLPLPKGLMGACDLNASIVFYYIPWIYQSWRRNELESFKEMLAKEPDRHKELQQWASDWRETHVRLNKKLTEQVMSSSAVKVGLHEDNSDEDGRKKKKKNDDEDSIFKIGHFEPRKNVIPRDCKAYYRELYKWYLRRRGRTTRLMEEKERKWYEEEERSIIKDLLKNKRIDLGQLQKAMIPLVQNENRLKAKEGRVIAMLAQADKIFKTAVSKIFNVVNFQVSYASKDSIIEHQEAYKLDGCIKEVEFYFGPNYKDAEEVLTTKLNATQFTDRSFKELVQEKLKKRELFNDRRRFWDPEEKWMRILARNIIEENGFICGQWEPHEITYEYRKYANRQKNIEEYKQLFGDEYDPLWDVGKTVTDLNDFPYNWPYVREEDLALSDESLMYRSEHKFPIVNTNSVLDLNFIANTDQDVVALMLNEQQKGAGAVQKQVRATIDLDDQLPQTRAIPLSNSKLSLFATDIFSLGEVEGDQTADNEKSADASSIDEHMDDDGIVIRPTKHVQSSNRDIKLGTVMGSEIITSESSENIGIKSRSKVNVANLESKQMKQEDLLDMQAESMLMEGIGIGDDEDEVAGESGELAVEPGQPGPSQQLYQTSTKLSTTKREDLDEYSGTSSDQVLLPGDPLYPENWREICEDDCLSEGESIPSPRSSPSNVTDFSEITEVELFVPSDAEEEPYQEYYDEAEAAPVGPAVARRPSHGDEEEPTEEYMGDSDDETESEGVRSARKRGPSLLKGKHVATSSSGSSDDDAEKRQDLERTFSQIIADRKVAMAEREQQLRELD